MTTLNRVGGIIMLISLFLPVVIILIGPVIIIQWMHGFGMQNRFPEPGWVQGWGMGWAFFGLQIITLVQIAFFIPLLVFSIHCIKKDPDKARLYGLLSIIIMVLYYILCYALVAAVMEELEFVGFLVIPHIGFFGIIIGSILNIIAK